LPPDRGVHVQEGDLQYEYGVFILERHGDGFGPKGKDKWGLPMVDF
jgi:hypothetical protein